MTLRSRARVTGGVHPILKIENTREEQVGCRDELGFGQAALEGADGAPKKRRLVLRNAEINAKGLCLEQESPSG